MQHRTKYDIALYDIDSYDMIFFVLYYTAIIDENILYHIIL